MKEEASPPLLSQHKEETKVQSPPRITTPEKDSVAAVGLRNEIEEPSATEFIRQEPIKINDTEGMKPTKIHDYATINSDLEDVSP